MTLTSVKKEERSKMVNVGNTKVLVPTDLQGNQE